MRCHRFLLSFQHPISGVTHDSQFLLLIMLATPDKQRLLLELLLFRVTVVIAPWFEVVPLVGHVWRVQETRGHRFALLD